MTNSFDVVAVYKKTIEMLVSGECVCCEDTHTRAGILGLILGTLTDDERQKIAKQLEVHLKILETLREVEIECKEF